MKKILEHLKSEWYKYLLEMLVVTVGILIAFSLNSWKEGRQERENEVEILQQLKIDLVENLDEINDIQRKMDRRIELIDSFIAQMERKPQFDSLMGLYLARMSVRSVFNNQNSAYKYIENEGFSFLTNRELRSAITKMYEMDFKNIHYRENMEHLHIQDHVDPFFSSRFEKRRVKISEGRYMEIWHMDPDTFENLRNSNSFKNLLLDLKSIRWLRTRRLKETSTRLEALIAKIDNEIAVLD